MYDRKPYIPLKDTVAKIHKATGLKHSIINVIIRAYIGYMILVIKKTGRPVHIHGFGTFSLNNKGKKLDNSYQRYLKAKKKNKDHLYITPMIRYRDKIKKARL